MKTRSRAWLLALLALALIPACGGSGGSGADTGAVNVSLTDAPGQSFDNVFITVKEVWFHKSADAGPDAKGPIEGDWLRYPITPQTVDLANLTDGRLGTILTRSLPVGRYQQIRLILVSNEDNVVTPGHTYNNEVVIAGDPNSPYPLDIPDTHKEVANPNINGHQNRGIKLVGTFDVTAGTTLDIAIDFDVGHDVVRITRSGGDEFFLKPRLRCIDLGDIGSISGWIDNVSAGSRYVVKAEQKSSDNTYRVVRRFTGIDNTGAFLLTFLKPGSYDVVIRGRNIETMIVKGVPVAKGATTRIPGLIPMIAGTEYKMNVSVSPTGSWVNFYQTVPLSIPGADNVPYHVRYRHLDPFKGTFHDNIALSSGQFHFGVYTDNVTPVSFTAVDPVETAGGFKMAASAGLGNIRFTRMYYSASGLVSDYASADTVTPADADTTVAFPGRLPITPPARGNQVAGLMTVPMTMGADLAYAAVFAVHGGMVIDRLDTFTAGPPYMRGNVYGFAMGALPGGSPVDPLPTALYGVEAYGFSPGIFAIGISRLADLRTGDDNVGNFTMFGMPR